MDPALQVLVEMSEWVWQRFKGDLADLAPAERDWRPLPQSNSINLLVRHLRIEAEWHRDCLVNGAPMPRETTDALQRSIDSVPIDFDANLKALDAAYAACLAALRSMTLEQLKERTGMAYAAWSPRPTHLLGYHQAAHLASHAGQIRTIRNLYQKTSGRPARFHPDNPSFPGESGRPSH